MIFDTQDRISVNVRLDNSDVEAFSKFLHTEQDAKRRRSVGAVRRWAVRIALFLLFALVVWITFVSTENLTFRVLLAVMSISAFISGALQSEALAKHAWMKKHLAPEREGPVLGQKRFTLGPTTLDIETEHQKQSMRWEGIRRIAQTEDTIFVFIDTAVGFVFPKSQLPDPDLFWSVLEQRVEQARG